MQYVFMFIDEEKDILTIIDANKNYHFMRKEDKFHE